MTFETWCDPETESPSEAVIRAIATVEGEEAAELEDPLYDSIDPESLDKILRSNSLEDLRVTFVYSGYQIEVQAAGRIVVQEKDS